MASLDVARLKRLEEFVKPFRVEPGSKVVLHKDFDPRQGRIKKKKGVELLAEGVRLLSEYQARLAAQDNWAVLVVAQALDAAGKDGAIRHVISGVNPQGVDVHSFKVPSAEELDHDYLWRYARRLPERGKIGIFNRSHYEKVLVVRVQPKNLERQHLPEAARNGDVWKRRYREINNWERYLTDNGIRIVKLFSEALSYTSTEWAPWHVILGDRRDRHRRVRRVGACPRGRRVGTNLTSPGPLFWVTPSGRHPDERRLS